MAFLRNQMLENQTKQGLGEGLLSGGESAVAGNAQSQAGTTGQKSKAQASPNAWYNVSDFLNANQKGGQKLQGTLQNQAQGLIDTDKSKAQESVAGINSIARPEAVTYTDQAADTADEGTVNKGLQQDWLKPNTSYDYSSYQIDPNKDITGMQEGSYGALTNFAKTAMPKRSNYSFGAQRMDEALLGKDPNFVQNFAKDTKANYQTSVLDPVANKIAEGQALDTSTDQALDTARGGWFSGLEGYLGGKQTAVNDTLAKQRSQYDAQRNRNIQEELYNAVNGIETKNALNNKNYLDLRNYVNQNAGNYSSFSGIDPNKETAAWQALGDQGVGRYNTLAGILGQNQGKAFDQMSSQKWQDPTWNLRTNDLRSAAQRQSYQNEMPDIANQIASYNQQINDREVALNPLRSQLGAIESRYAQQAPQIDLAEASDRTGFMNDQAWKQLSGEASRLNAEQQDLRKKLTPWQQRQSALSKYLNG
jgi:hypothetical protein